jgi:hypothetical protein
MLQTRLNTLPQPAGADLFSDYVSARRFVVEEVAENIPRAEPDLTDHGPRHIADVMRRVHELLAFNLDYFSAHEIYILAVSILFHDVGNLHGRQDHQKKVASVHVALRRDDARYRNERNAVLVIAGAHTGTTRDGSKDTLRDIDRLSFQGVPIRGREIASVLRLADELAEGEHRTSAYLQNIGAYSTTSAVYHAYANAVDYCVEGAGTGRIAMTFTIDLTNESGSLTVGNNVQLADLLELCYRRIVKLDQERRYCKHYCTLLSGLSETGAWFRFYSEGQRLETGLQPLVLSDLVIPGDLAKTIDGMDPGYTISTLLAQLEALCGGGSTS